MQKLNKTFIIVNKETQEQWVAHSGKSSDLNSLLNGTNEIKG